VTGTTIADLGLRAKAASRVLATTSTTRKDRALLAAADGLVAATTRILDANAVDVARAEAQGVSATVVDRLRLTPARVEAMAGGLRQVAGLPDPVGEVLDGWVRPNGLRISRVRVPLGVVAIIYENRPNVTSDAAGLCLKSGNAAFLRGSSGAISSNIAIATVLRAAYEDAGLPADALVLVEDTSREAAVEFMRQRGAIDVLIPRGGPSLIQSILDNATVPYVIDGDGNCHVYVDESADLEMAARIVTNAKTQRPSVCNAAETLLVHKAVAEAFLGGIDDVLPGVELVADTATLGLLPDSVGATEATDEDWAQEFLDLKMAVKVVGSIDCHPYP
jgi:glutamate-5-semialdehyde dehydrogenase